MTIRHIAIAAALVAAAATGFAQTVAPAPATPPTAAPDTRGTHTPLIDKQEANQEDRIKQGRQSGELTKHEARRMKAEQKAVDRTQTKAAADGTVTGQERRHIRRMQDRTSKDIYRQKHDEASKTPPAAGQ